MLSLAQQVADAREDLPTSLGTDELRKLGSNILRQSLFSARMTNAGAVQGVRNAITAILSGMEDQTSDTVADARLKLKAVGQMLGYDPSTGFPGGPEVPPAEAGTLQDLFSTQRLDLILDTQDKMTKGAAKNIWGNEAAELEEYPAWELVRGFSVEVPRGTKETKKGEEEVPEDAWDGKEGRWAAALDEADDDEASAIFESSGRMVARKDSEVWQALGDGAGDHSDTLGNDFEPFAYRSGMVRVPVSAADFEALGGDPDGVEADETEFGADKVKVGEDRFDADILKTLKESLESGDLKFRVKVEVTP